MKFLNPVIVSGMILLSISSHAQSQFTNNGNFKIHSGGTMSVYGDFVNNGSLTDSGEVITLAGSTIQQIGGDSVTTFKNLTLINAAGSYLTGNEKIIGELTITTGTFTTTGYDFTLVSDEKGTARIAPILGDFAGNITMQRYLGTGPSDWRFLATPVSGATISSWQDNFITSGFPGSTYPSDPFVSIYTYDETVGGTSDNGYVEATNSSNTLVPGIGYQCYIGPTPLTVDVTGPPAKFNQNLPVTYSSSGNADEDGWLMIGNPYPSAIDWNSPDWTKHNINDAVYIWNAASQQYASWVGGVGINGGSSIIESSQSFWVQANGANPILSSTENCKTSASSIFMKTAGTTSLNLVKVNLIGNNYKDEAVLQFGTGGTNGYDSNLDARKLYSSNADVPGIATQDATHQDLSINSLPEINTDLSIPLKTLVGVTGTYTITIDSNYIIPNNYGIVLEDLSNGIITEIGNTLAYSFTISDTTTTPRFVIHILQKGPAVLPIELLSFTANENNTNVDLNWTTESEINNHYFEIERSTDATSFEYVSSVMARGDGNSSETQNYKTTDTKPYIGESYYRLKQFDKNGVYKYSPITAVNINAKHLISVYPNPVINTLTIEINDDYLNSTIKIVDAIGKEVMTMTLTSFANEIDISSISSGVYYVIIESNNSTTAKYKILIQN